MTSLERTTVCTFDCPDTCSLLVGVENDRIVKVRGSKALPYTNGVLCNKVAHGTVEMVHGGRRLLYPLKRTGPRGSGSFERIAWEEALDHIHDRVSSVISQFGPQAVLPQ
jgi:anaerobic selenocysteine-containing dehydrogenase